MRIFVTGATGFIGIPVVEELISAGHKVLGMARSDEGAKSLKVIGADVHRGSLEDLESLKNGAAVADAVIHLAFVHDFSKFQENCETDKRAIETLGSVLAGSQRPFIVTAGTGGLAAPGQVATEDMDVPPNFPFPRVSEQTALALKDVNASVMRLPQVHDTVKQGLVTYLIGLAREKGLSAFVSSVRPFTVCSTVISHDCTPAPPSAQHVEAEEQQHRAAQQQLPPGQGRTRWPGSWRT